MLSYFDMAVGGNQTISHVLFFSFCCVIGIFNNQ